VPAYQPAGTGGGAPQARRTARGVQPFRTQHTGLPKTPRPPAARRAPKPS
jgi:hypothetical protein